MAESETKLSRILNVRLNHVDVGTLTLLADDRTLFAFAPSYVQNPDRPTLSLWFKTPMGELKTAERIRHAAMLPPFFSNLLPEGHLRDYLAKKADVKSGREFFLLAALGRDLPGAVRVEPPGQLHDDGGEQPRPAPERSRILRFSLAGVHLKFSAILESTGGLTVPADGVGGSWIVKLPSSSYKHVPEAEFSMLTLAKRVGITVPEFKLIPTASVSGLPRDIQENFGESLAVKRFDRDGEKRVHMEDFAQVLGIYPHEKYENASFDRIGFVLLSECGEADFTQFVKRLTFTLLTGNGDMHLKNWSLLYSDGKTARLSPAYDYVPTIIYLPKDDLGLRLGGEREFREITERHFSKFAAKAIASERMVLRTVRETVEQFHCAWHELRSDLPLTKDMKSTLESYMKTLRLRPTRTIYALPTLDLQLTDVLGIEEDRVVGAERACPHRALGYTYVYNLDKLLAAVRASGETLDQFLTRNIAANLYGAPVKGALAILYAPLRDKLFLTASGKHNPACRWLSEIAGCEESGKDLAPNYATPLIYWNGQKVYRVYQPLGHGDDQDTQDAYFITDLGKWNPPFIQQTDSGTYSQIANSNRDPMYTAVPRTAQETIQVNGRARTIHHAFMNLSE